LFDRPKPTAGCSANGEEGKDEEEEEEETHELKCVSHSVFAQKKYSLHQTVWFFVETEWFSYTF
jgi:hypothetical protein